MTQAGWASQASARGLRRHLHPRRPTPPPDPRERAKDEALAATRSAAAHIDADRAEHKSWPHARLRTVVLSHATLPRFLCIASANSVRNLETCGLFRGREVPRVVHVSFFSSSSGLDGGSGKFCFVVETPLIPKQHATSDTCTINEEKGILGFTEARKTHHARQVVCTPKSNPNLGIFRLTDPPGLQMVLQRMQAFHLYPIYTVRLYPIFSSAAVGLVIVL
ncbi:hypothetical protein DFH09DRAFT_1341290 [Mycena vulgaris]|nr:hypothetical protein DFH09DRAFT_1341290 [Mycena vulgaris]